MKYSRGPWKANTVAGDPFYCYVYSQESDCVVIWLDRREDGSPAYADRCIADAQLIAAAPELLEALQNLLKHCGIADAAPEDKDAEDHAFERAARAAIAKALGQTN